MARIRKILRVIAILVAVALLSLAFAVSHDAACGAAPALAKDAKLMKAIVYRCYGSPDVLRLEDIEKPIAADDELLIKVHAAALNPLDWHYRSGTPYFMRLDTGMGRPKSVRLGVDFAGTVEAVGKDVTRFRPGDAVFGGSTGAFAEYVTIRADRALAMKPAGLSFAQAAAIPIAALTALQALRDKGQLQAGQSVLINGASGGVGTFAVQLAKYFGAEVTGVCSTRNVAMVRALGADHVIDYTKEDFTQGKQHYDLIVDMVGSHSLREYKRVLATQGNFVIVGAAGGPEDGRWLGPLVNPIKAWLWSPFVKQKFGLMIAEFNQADLTLLGDLMQAGKVTPVIDRTYSLSEVPEAMRYLELGHARGKVVIVVQPDGTP